MNTLVLPNQLLGLVSETSKATVLGLLTFFGLLAGMLIQPVAGLISDRTHPKRGRRSLIGLGVVLILASLALFGLIRSLTGVILGYLAIQIAASVAQAGQQAFIPDLVPARHRGMSAGLKGFMDIGGAMLGFLLLGQLLGSGQVEAALGVIGLVLLLGYLLTAVLVKEDRPAAVHLEAARRGKEHQPLPILLSDAFRLDLRHHRAFTWLILSRFLFLLGTYAVGRFLVFFVADRLALEPARATEQAGSLLAGLALVTVLAAIPAGWASDRFGRVPLMILGAALSALSVLLLILAGTAGQILIFGSFMALGSALFGGANWAQTADLAPQSESARFLGLANFGTAGAAAAAGLFGPFVDWANLLSPGTGYTALFLSSALAFLGSALALKGVIRRGEQVQPDIVHSPEIPQNTSEG